jgi:glycosyltransferase involved in cell wall biosynthesis
MYKILVINWQDITHPLGGGAEVHLHEIFKRIVAKGHLVTLLCCHYPGALHEEIINGIKIIRHGHRSLFNFFVPVMYRKLMHSETYDVVFDDINKIPFYTPLFVKKPLIGIIHHLFGKSIFQEAIFPAAFYVYASEKLIPFIYRNTPLMAVSPSSKNELVAKGIPQRQIEVVYNGVDTTIYKPALAAKSPVPLIGYLGRIKRYKSIEHSIHAFKIVKEKLPAARMVIVGGGDHLPILKKLVENLELSPDILFTDYVSESEKIRYLNQMWVCINPSPKEGWGVSVIESNACGTPVIAADSPGLRDSVVPEHTGWLYPYGNIEVLATQISRLIEENQIRDKFVINAINWARKYDWEISALQTLSLIARIIDSNSN